MTNSISHIVKKRTIQMGSNFISPEPAKTIACVGQKSNKTGQKKAPV